VEENIDTVQKNINPLLEEEVGLEENPDKTKYMTVTFSSSPESK
jgi:hypothetical protein